MRNQAILALRWHSIFSMADSKSHLSASVLTWVEDLEPQRRKAANAAAGDWSRDLDRQIEVDGVQERARRAGLSVR